MASKAYGSIIKLGGEAGNAVAQLRSLKPSGITVDLIETTAHDNETPWATFMPAGVADAGEWELEMACVPSTFSSFLEVLLSEDTEWAVTLPNGLTFEFVGILTKLNPADDITPKGELVASATIKVSGPISEGGTLAEYLP